MYAEYSRTCVSHPHNGDALAHESEVFFMGKRGWT